MAYTTEFVDNGRGVIHLGSGIVTGAEIIDGAVLSLHKVRDGMPLRYGITDLTELSRFDITTAEVHDIARVNIAIAEIIETLSVAVVAPSDHAFGMARMWEVRAGPTGWLTRVFRDAGEARAWLAACAGRHPPPGPA